MSNLSLRLISGSLYVVIMVAAVVYGNPFFVGLVGLIAFFSINELAVLAKKEGTQSLFGLPFLLGGIIVYLNVSESKTLEWFHYLAAFVGQWLCVFIIFYFFKAKQKVQFVASVFYTWLPLAALGFWYTQANESQVEYLLFFLIAIWLYDSMAYTVGRWIGKTPIFPKVSPKKTIEGAVGGAIITVVVMFFANQYWLKLPENVFLLAFVVVFFGTFGDFVESYLKRKLGIKDSGTLIPGHGGILDRVDSILLAVLPYILIIILF